MIPPTQSSSVGSVTREYKKTVAAAAMEKTTKIGLRPIRSASWPNMQMPSTIPRTVVAVHNADLARLKPLPEKPRSL